MQKQVLEGGRNRLPDLKTLEVARFVWERERLNDYKRPSWSTLLDQWSEEHSGARIKPYNNFRQYCTRGVKAVIELNFGWPQPDEKYSPNE